MFSHIRRRDLRTYAADSFTPDSEHVRHLETCAICQERLAWYRALRRTAADLPDLGPSRRVGSAPSPSAISGQAGAAVRRRGAGYFLARAAVLALAAIPVLLLSRGERLSARSSELRFEERIVSPGALAQVRYSPSMSLVSEDSVIVRARFRRAGDRRYDATLEARPAGVLRRTEDGNFVGYVSIPEGAVYGVLAVETAGADRVDTNFGRLFEVHVEDGEKGRLTLQQKVHDLLSRSWEAAVEVQREIALQFPDDPFAWEQLLALEQEIVPAGRLDSLRAAHRERRDELAFAAQASNPVQADDAAALLWYSILLGDADGQRHWKEVLLATDPTHPRSVEQRAYAIVMEGGGDGAVVAKLENLWQEVGSAHRFLPEAGVQAALRLDDPALVETWGDRYLLLRPDADRWVARQFLRFPALRPEGLRRLQRALDQAEDDARRALDLDREAYLSSTAAYRSSLHFDIASGLVEGGAIDEAVPHLMRAVELDWNPDAYRTLAEVQVRRTQSSVALQSLARVAADPATGFTADSAAVVLGEAVDARIWREAVATAEAVMVIQVADRAERLPLPLNAVLLSEAGDRSGLGALVGGSPTVIVYWSPYCGPALDVLPELDRLAEKLEARDVRLLLVTTEPRSNDVIDALRTRGLELTTYYDERRDLARALDQFGTPSFYVLDGEGNLRFRKTSLDRLEREVASIDRRAGPA